MASKSLHHAGPSSCYEVCGRRSGFLTIRTVYGFGRHCGLSGKENDLRKREMVAEQRLWGIAFYDYNKEMASRRCSQETVRRLMAEAGHIGKRVNMEQRNRVI